MKPIGSGPVSKQAVVRIAFLAFALVTCASSAAPIAPSAAQGNCRRFEQTGQQVCGRFLEYWTQNGDLAQQGYPISGEVQERSDTDGKTYTVQYFERAVFEYHPENSAPYDVFLSLLGTFEYYRRYSVAAPDHKASTDNPTFFQKSGRTLGGRFRAYWEAHGGLAQQGYPISDEFQERSGLDGKVYTVQYFERAVFEYHPENQSPHDVLLSLLGRFRYDYKTYKQAPNDCFTLSRWAGTLIAQGSNTVPTDGYWMTSYKLEEINLAGPITCMVPMPGPTKVQVQWQNLTFDKYWRFTITGEQDIFGPRASNWLLWLDDTLAGLGGGDRRTLRLFVYDPTPLREGATIGVTYDGAFTDTFPGKLHFNRAP